MSRYGGCPHCGTDLEAVWFVEYEYAYQTLPGCKTIEYKTGRKRDNIDYLVCPVCGKREVIDDSFASSWR